MTLTSSSSALYWEYPLCPKCRHNTVSFGTVSIEGRTWGVRCPICAWEEVEFIQDAGGATYRPWRELTPPKVGDNGQRHKGLRHRGGRTEG